MKTSQKDFERFKAEFSRWQRLLGLTDWRVCFCRRKLSAYAEIATDIEGRIATVSFGTEHDEKNYEDVGYCPVNTGRHEAIELLLAELVMLSTYRFIRLDEIDAARHAVIRRLENLFDTLKGQL